MLFLRPRVATLRLKNHANRAQHSTCITCYQSLLCLTGESVITNKPEWHLKNSTRERRNGPTLKKRNTKINMLNADMKN